MKSIISVLLAIVILGGGWYWYTTMAPATQTSSTTTTTNDNQNGADLTPPTDSTGAVSTDTTASAANAAPTEATVTYTAAGGFSPSSVTIKKGGVVTWVNKDTGAMWVATASHPTHTVYSGTSLQQHCDTQSNDSFDQCENSETYSFQFDKLGKWNYHNHSSASKFGSVTVVE